MATTHVRYRGNIGYDPVPSSSLAQNWQHRAYFVKAVFRRRGLTDCSHFLGKVPGAMTSITTLLSDGSRKLLGAAVVLRSLVRQLDAPVLHKWLNEAAQLLEDAQKDLDRSEEDAERAYLALENILHNGIDLPYDMRQLLSRYRQRHPRKPFTEYNQPFNPK